MTAWHDGMALWAALFKFAVHHADYSDEVNRGYIGSE